jgi:GTP pyrophosphokinase
MVPGEGVIVHSVDCDVLDRHQDSMIDWMDVRWRDRREDSAFSIARVGVRVENTAGSLASIANIISRNGANISNLKITNRNPLYFELQIDLEVRDTQHLEHIIRALKVDSAVELVERSRGLDTDDQDSARSASDGKTQGVLI